MDATLTHSERVLREYKRYLNKEKKYLPKLLKYRDMLLEDHTLGGEYWSVGKYKRLMTILDQIKEIKHAADYIDAHESPYKDEADSTENT